MKLVKTKFFIKWSAGLKDNRARSLIAARLDRLEEGHFGDHRTIGGDVFELRLHYGPGYRIYLTQQGDEIIILLAGGTKRTQSRDIKRAKQMVKSL